MQPTYATLINELVQEYHTKWANLRAATATPPELQQLDNDYAYWLSIGLEDALGDAWAAGDIDSAAQIDRIIRQFYRDICRSRKRGRLPHKLRQKTQRNDIGNGRTPEHDANVNQKKSLHALL